MVAMSMSHRYSTGRLVSKTLREDSRGRMVARVLLRGESVDAFLEARHVHAFRLAMHEQGLKARVMMERDGSAHEWTVHHVCDSPVWDAAAEPRIKPILHSWEREEVEARRLAA